jgi:hypothetical protein
MLAALALAIPALAGCTNFDPDKLDVFGLNERRNCRESARICFPGVCRA